MHKFHLKLLSLVAFIFLFPFIKIHAEPHLLQPQTTSQQVPLDRSDTVTFDFKNTDIKDVLRAIGTSKGINIVTEPSVQGNITIHLEDVPLEVGLKTLLEANGFTYEKKDSIYRVFKIQQVQIISAVYTAGLLSLDVRGGDILDVLVEIARKAGINIVADKTVQGKVNIRLDRVPLDTALQTFLNANGFIMAKVEGIYRVSATEKAVPVTMNISEGLVSLDVEDADLGKLARQIAIQSGLNLIIFGSVREPVNARFNKILLDDALSLIFKGSRYSYKRDGNILMVGEPTLTGPAANALTSRKLIKLKYLRADEVMPLLPSTISAANIKVIKEQNAIVVVGTDEFIKNVDEFIEIIDHSPQQIMIEALVVEYSKKRDLNVGVSGGYQKDRVKSELLSSGALGVSLQMESVAKLPEDFQASLSALVSRGKAQIKTSPRIATINGQEAVINVGEIRYFETTTVTQLTPTTSLQSIAAGIILKIKPWVNASNEITAEIHPEISGVTATGKGGLPEVTKRTVDTTIRVKSGETIIIGGLITAEESKQSDRIPLLGEIPILGMVFGNTKNSTLERELVIYITPKIISQGDIIDKEKLEKEKK